MRTTIYCFLSFLLSLSTNYANAMDAGSWYAITIGGKGIIIPNATVVNNSQLQIWTQTNVPSQLWQYIENEDGSVSFKEGYADSYICCFGTQREGTKVTFRSESTKRSYGNWILIPANGSSDTYYISTTDSLYYIGVTQIEDTAGLTLKSFATEDEELVKWTFTEYDGNVSTEFDEAARDQIMNGFINQYYHAASSGCVLGGGGWWGDAEMFETILDAFETTGDKTYQTYFQKLVINFVSRNGSDWTYNSYNDDITWMVLASIRGYKYFHTSTYLNYAKDNYDKMYSRALENEGALRWCEESQNRLGSNSCINCPAIVAACYLYEITGEEEYLEKAQNTYAFQREHLFKPSTGQVYDSGSWDSSGTVFTVGNEWASTYNQGTMLGAATKLWILTGNEQYKTDAEKVYTYAYNNLTNSDKIINVCQTSTGDLCGFKGILMRYVRLYAQTFATEDPMLWMEDNAWFAMQNANSAGVIWSKWLTKTPEDFMDGTTDFSNDAFGASTAVSVAFNAHVNRQFFKDAYSFINAEMFDDIQFMQIAATHDDELDAYNTTRAKTGYIAFMNVDFGSSPATQAILRAYSASDTGSYSLYADKISEETKLGEVAVLSAGWNTYTIDIPETSFLHTIYAVPESSGSTMFRYIRFTNGTDGIRTTENTEVKKTPADGIYNLVGQRMRKPAKGVNIINGKKILSE